MSRPTGERERRPSDWFEAVDLGSWFGPVGWVVGAVVGLVGWIVLRHRREARR